MRVAPDTLAQRCASASRGRTVYVTSSSGSGRYSVYVGGSGPEDCSCPGFRFHRRCRHLAIARQQLCDWSSGDDPEQTLSQNVGMICPRCGGPTELSGLGWQRAKLA